MAVRNGKTEKAPVLVRVVKFQIFPTDEQMSTLQKVSDNLWQIWNDCLEWRQKYFNEHIRPLYEELKSAVPEEITNIKSRIKVAYASAPVYHVAGVPERSQASWLTTMRQSRSDFAAIPCGWQQECLKILEGSFASFAQLRHKGDTTARPPRLKDVNSFCEIQGCVGWQLQTSSLLVNPQKELGEVHQHAIANSDGMEIVLSPGKTLPGGAELRLPVPEYQRLVLSQAVKLNKFTLYRDKKKRFWISIAYAVPEPVAVEKTSENIVFVSLGASHLSMVSEKGERVIDLWRPDKHWMPLINETRRRELVPVLQSEAALARSVAGGYVTAETVASAKHLVTVMEGYVAKRKIFDYEEIPLEERKLFLAPKQKGSKEWEELFAAYDRMYEIMRLQQLQNQREVISQGLKAWANLNTRIAMVNTSTKQGRQQARLLRRHRHSADDHLWQHGVHFVLIEHSPIRGKKGALADTSKNERGGADGLNYAAQNTGSLARLKQLLEQKAAEWGGTVSTMRLEDYPEGDVREKKLEAARMARALYLKAA